MRVLGMDGCPGGWACLYWDGAQGLEILRLPSVEAAMAHLGPQGFAAIDMPIGLPERSFPGGREAERAVRPLLGMRQSSVFSVPSRAAVEAGADETIPEAERYRHACTVARATSEPPRAISKQAFAIFPKIREIDLLLQRRPDLVTRLWECHPEVSFRTMLGEAVPVPKKVKGRISEEGLAVRRDRLAEAGFPVGDLTRETARRLRMGWDDLVDAAACAWTAWRIGTGVALSYPDPPERDAKGLPVAIRA